MSYKKVLIETNSINKHSIISNNNSTDICVVAVEGEKE